MNIAKNLISLFKSDDGIIEFLLDPDDLGNIPEPKSAAKVMPAWFKDIPPRVLDRSRDGFGGVAATVKKCMPMLDALSLGFVIPLFADFNVRTDDAGLFMEFNGMTPLGPVAESHGANQLNGSLKLSPNGQRPALKFINRIVVKTAPGYSTLFIPPLGVIESRFTCLPGLVDTDKYPKHVNFPAVWHANGYDGIIKAGTPLVTAIPIRRQDMPRTAKVRSITQEESKIIADISRRQATRTGVYSDELRESRK